MHSKCTIFQLIYGLNRLLWAGLGTYPFNNIVSVRYQVWTNFWNTVINWGLPIQ